MQQNMGALEAGKCCDIVSLDLTHPALIGKSGDDWLNGWIFSGDGRCVRDVWVGGKQVVANGHHMARENVARDFARAMEHLLG